VYLFQIRRLTIESEVRNRYTAWKTIQTFPEIPELDEDLTFPSGMVQFRLILRNREVWRSDGKMRHVFKNVAEVSNNTIILKTRAS
jgi:hypothetical protein